MNDVDLDDRLRAALGAIADEAGPPPDWSAVGAHLGRSPAGAITSSRSWWPSVASIAVVAVLVVAGLALIARRDRHGASDAPSELWGWWRLTSITVDGSPVDVVPSVQGRDIEWEFVRDVCSGRGCETSPGIWGDDGCNGFSRLLEEFGEGSARWGPVDESSLVACSGTPLLDAIDRFMVAPAFSVTVHAGRLRLEADGVVLEFVSASSTPPTTPEQVATTSDTADALDPFTELVQPLLPDGFTAIYSSGTPLHVVAYDDAGVRIESLSRMFAQRVRPRSPLASSDQNRTHPR